MHLPTTESGHPVPLVLVAVRIAAIAVIGIALASIAVSATSLIGFAPVALSEAQAEPPMIELARTGYRCTGCGVIVSTREIDVSPGEALAKPLKNYEINVRMQDGSMRRIVDAKPAVWRHGEAVTIVDGVQ